MKAPALVFVCWALGFIGLTFSGFALLTQGLRMGAGWIAFDAVLMFAAYFVMFALLDVLHSDG